MRARKLWFGLLGTLALAGLAASASAQPVGLEFQVNSYTTNDQDFPAVASDANGAFVVVWESDGQDGNDGGIFAQRYDSAGNKRGSEFRVNSQTTFLQEEPAVAFDPAGNFVVVWTSYQDPGPGIFAQRYDSAGNTLGGEFRVNTYTTSRQESPAVASDATGTFVVVWDSFSQDGSNAGVFGQRFDSGGNKLGGEFRVNSYTLGNQANPAVASDPSGNFVIVWGGSGQGDSGVFGQRYDSAGVAVGAEFRVNSYTSFSQGGASVAAAPNGDFVVVWTSFRQEGGLDDGVFGQRYDSLGNAQGAEFQVNTHTTGFQRFSSVALDPGGDFVVAWESEGNLYFGDWGIFAQRYDVAGNRLGQEFQVNSFITGNQLRPSVAATDTSQFVVAWMSRSQDGSGEGVFAQRYEFSGLPTIHVGDLDRKAKNVGATWRAQVKTMVHDDNHLAVSGVLVTLNVSGGVGTRTCTTVASGVCEVSVVVGDAVPSLIFTVTNLSRVGLSYDRLENHDPDTDSDGTMIIVRQP